MILPYEAEACRSDTAQAKASDSCSTPILRSCPPSISSLKGRSGLESYSGRFAGGVLRVGEHRVVGPFEVEVIKQTRQELSAAIFTRAGEKIKVGERSQQRLSAPLVLDLSGFLLGSPPAEQRELPWYAHVCPVDSARGTARGGMGLGGSSGIGTSARGDMERVLSDDCFPRRDAREGRQQG